MIVTCPNQKCGAKYELGATRLPLRDKDSLTCQFCGSTIHEWNETNMWHVEKVLKVPKKS